VQYIYLIICAYVIIILKSNLLHRITLTENIYWTVNISVRYIIIIYWSLVYIMIKRLDLIKYYTHVRSCFHESVILICFALTTSSLIHEISLCFNNHTWCLIINEHHNIIRDCRHNNRWNYSLEWTLVFNNIAAWTRFV